ncbi:MAG: hypothetical protein R3F29_01245 [Planctomycetota bacterium]
MLRPLAVAAFSFAALAPLGRAQVLELLPADTTNVIFVGDLLTPAQQLLASPDVAAVLDVLAPMLEAELGFAPDAARLKQQLALFADMVPTQLAIGMPTETVDSFYYAAQAFLSVSAAAVLRGQEVAELRQAMQAKAKDGLAGFHGLDAVVVAKMRSERAAEQLFERLSSMSDAATDAGFQVERGDEAVTLQADMVELGRDALERPLRLGGVELPKDFAWQLRLRLELAGDAIVLRLGDAAAGPLDPAKLGSLWASEDPPLLFERTESNVWGELYELQGLVVGAIGSAEDESAIAMLVKAYEMLDNLSVVVESGSSALRVDHGVRIDYEEELDEDLVELMTPPSSLARSVAGETGPWLLLPSSLDVLLADLCDLLIDAEDEGFAAFYDYVSGEDSMLFAEGVAVVMRAAEFRGAEAMGIGKMPWGAFALVARADDEGSAEAFMEAVHDCLVEDLAIDGAPWAVQDLGLGVETRAFDLQKCAPEFAAMGVDADFAPHWLVVDGHLIVSTDAALSREVVARLRKEPAAHPAADAWAGGRFDGAALRGIVDGAGQWFTALTGGSDADVDAVMTALRRLVDTVDHVEVDKRPEQNSLRTRAVLRLR